MANDCSDYEGIVPAEVVALTPREGWTIEEEVALCLSDAAVAPTEVFDRVVLDLDAIKSTYPEIDFFWAGLDFQPGRINFSVNSETILKMESEKYTAWNCVNSWYGMMSTNLNSWNEDDTKATGNVILNGLFDINYFLNEYETLDGFLDVYASVGGTGDGSHIRGHIDGDTYTYLYDYGSEDCPSGCIYHEYWLFSVETAGEPTLVDTYFFDGLSGEGDTRPSWVTDNFRCGDEIIDGD